MRIPTDDIAPLAELADERFRALMDDAHASANRLADFWTKLYGPNEVGEMLRAPLNSLEDNWNDEEEKTPMTIYETETPPSGEPAPGYVIRGPYSDGTFRAFERADDGAQHVIGSADDYETARDLCVSKPRRDATEAELADEPHAVLEEMDAGRLDATPTTRMLARRELDRRAGIVRVIQDASGDGFGFETPDGEGYGAASLAEAMDRARRLGFDPRVED